MAAHRFHIIIDVSNVSQKVLEDTSGLEGFLKELPGIIGMTILKGPEVVIGTPDNPGITGFVIINFSHISVHTFTSHGQALVDIFSCREFDQEKAENFVLEYFKVSKESAKIQEVNWA
jgi:S-adenosylmethionine decarboxylase